MKTSRLVESALVLIAAAAVTTLLAHPLVLKMDRVGRMNTGDGQVSIWNVAWVAHALTTSPSTVFEANIYHPHTRTLAFSEANLVAGTLAIPAWLATRNPFFAHNSAAVAGFILSFLGAYVLVRRLTRHPGAALFAGIAFAFCPFIYARTAHIQLLMTAGLPWSLWLCHRLIDSPTVPRAAWLGLVVAIQALACGYYGIFAGLAVALAIVYYAFTRGLWRRPRYWGLALLAGVLSVLLVLPVFRHYASVEGADFNRDLSEAASYSANWQAYLASPTRAHVWMLAYLEGRKEVAFPGYLTTSLAATALVLGARRRWRRGKDESDAASAMTAHASGTPAETVGYYALLAGLAAWCSFGPDAGLYSVLYHAFPPFGFLRAPGRMAIVVTLGLVVCASQAVAYLARGGVFRRWAVTTLVVLLTVAELAMLPLPIPEINPRPHPVYRALANLPAAPVCEFPFFWNRLDFSRHARYMVNSTAHWRPLVNGYSDHIPSDFREMVLPLSGFPTRAAFRILQERKVRYVVFNLRLYDQRSWELLLERLEAYKEFVDPIIKHDDVWLYEIVAWPS